MTEDTIIERFFGCRLYTCIILVVGIIMAGGVTSMISILHDANAQGDELSSFENNDKLSKIVEWQGAQYPNTFLEGPHLKQVSNLGNPLLPMQSNTRDPVIQDVLSRINLTIISPLVNGEEKPLLPEYRLTQVNETGRPDFRIFHYLLKENPQQYDIGAVVGVVPIGDEYLVEVAKLAPSALKVNVDGEEVGTFTSSNATGQLGLGFLNFRIPN
jgi:hypothetical protein